MRWLGRFLLSLILVGVLAPTPSGAQQTLRAAAVVNDEVISEMDLHMRVQLTMLSSGMDGSPQQARRLASQVLRTLIRERLQIQEARRLGLEVSEEDVQQAANQIAQRNNMSGDQFIQALQRNGIAPSAFLNRIRANIAWNKVVSREIRPDLDIPESEVEKVVEQRKARQGQREMRVREIFLSADDDSLGNVRDTARRLIRELRSGTNFGQLARQFSQAATAAADGDLGWITAASLPEQAAEQLRDAQPGSLIGPINTFNGVYIFALQDTREIRAGGVKEVTLTQLLHELPDSADDATVAEAEARLDEIVADVESCQAFTAAAEDAEAVQVVNLGAMDPQNLPERIRETIAPLDVGEPSETLQVGGGLSVLAVCGREKAGVDRQRIRQNLMRDRGNMLAERYMRDLRRKAFIDIRLGGTG